MQCYERQAMYLQLNSDAVLEIPQLEYDPLLLDEVLTEFSINSFARLVGLNSQQRGEIIKRIQTIAGCEEAQKTPPAARQDRGERKKPIPIPRVAARRSEGLTTFPTIFP